MVWNAKKTRFYSTLIPSDLVDLSGPEGLYEYVETSLTFCAWGTFQPRPLQIGNFVEMPIA